MQLTAGSVLLSCDAILQRSGCGDEVSCFFLASHNPSSSRVAQKGGQQTDETKTDSAPCFDIDKRNNRERIGRSHTNSCTGDGCLPSNSSLKGKWEDATETALFVSFSAVELLVSDTGRESLRSVASSPDSKFQTRIHSYSQSEALQCNHG